MHKQLPSWEFLLEQLRRKKRVMLLYVIESKGSSPGRQGFMMVVNEAGEMHGSLGGGIMEHKFVELAKEKLQGQQDRVLLFNQKHDKVAARNQSGMICSGEQTILMHRANPADLPIIERIAASLHANGHGCLQFSPTGIAFSEKIPTQQFYLNLTDEQNFLYEEKTGFKNELTIIGGGHVALALSKLISELDFYIRLYDHRDNLYTMQQNLFVQEKNVVNDFAGLAELVTGGPDHFAVVMTVGYRTDAIALKAIINKNWKYLGILGSNYKIAKLKNDFEKEGFSPHRLSSIHAPIGIAIKSQTPEEIAISIAAEMILVKNRDC